MNRLYRLLNVASKQGFLELRDFNTCFWGELYGSVGFNAYTVARARDPKPTPKPRGHYALRVLAKLSALWQLATA